MNLLTMMSEFSTPATTPKGLLLMKTEITAVLCPKGDTELVD